MPNRLLDYFDKEKALRGTALHGAPAMSNYMEKHAIAKPVDAFVLQVDFGRQPSLHYRRFG